MEKQLEKDRAFWEKINKKYSWYNKPCVGTKGGLVSISNDVEIDGSLSIDMDKKEISNMEFSFIKKF